jgi:hypothetical protein
MRTHLQVQVFSFLCKNQYAARATLQDISVVHLTLVCITIHPYIILFHYLHLILLTNMQKHLDYVEIVSIFFGLDKT